jgi:hypothetical protein
MPTQTKNCQEAVPITGKFWFRWLARIDSAAGIVTVYEDFQRAV